MTALPTYSTGTVSIDDGDLIVVGTGTIWSGVNAKPGDTIYIDGAAGVEIKDVTDTGHLTLWTAWAGGDKSGSTYIIVQNYPARVVGVAAAEAVGQLISALNTNGFYWFVGPDEGEPDPSLGDEGQYALQATTGKTWQKYAGVWEFVGIYKGINPLGAWSGATDYEINDVVSLSGGSYLCILAHTNHTPPNATYWTVLAAKGDTGATGPTGAGYGGTSTTSLAIGTGSKAFTTQAGLAYQNGARVRASSAANTANWMEGLVTYSGTTLTMTSDKTNGSGTKTDWNLNVVGAPGAGDLTSANNLSDLASAATSRTNLGVDVATRTLTGTDTIVATDRGKLLLLNSATAFTLAVTAAATLGDGFWCRVKNINTGLPALDPNSSETIDGKATLTVGLGEELQITCNGSAFHTSASRGKLVELSRQVASTSGSLSFNFAAGFPADFDEFEVHLVNIVAATNDDYLACRIKTTASLTSQASSYLYAARIQGSGGGADGGSTVDGLTTHIPLARPVATSGMGNGSTFVLNGVMKVSSPNSTARQTIEGRSGYFRQTAVDYVNWTYTGAWVGNSDPITGLVFFMSVGNIASGSFVLYGIRK